jgi:O-antigen/teichoic acid export membrane protein
MTGHTRVKLANSVAWIAVLVTGNVLLIPRWGVVGAAVASLLSTAVVNVARVIEVWVLERTQPFDRTFVNPALAGLVAYAAGMALSAWGPPVETALHVGLNAVLLTGVYGAVCYVLGVAPEDRDIIERGLRKIARTIRRGRPAVAPTPAGRR